MFRATTCLTALTSGLLFCAADSNSPSDLLVQAQQLIERGDRMAALTQLKEAIRLFPNEPGFYNLVGVVDAQSGNYGSAETNFRKAVELAPRFTGALLNLGRLYQENAAHNAGATAKALDAYETILKFDPDNVEANYQAASLLELKGSHRMSLQHLYRLPVGARARPQALALRCAAYAGLGDHQRANEAASLLMDSDANEADILGVVAALERSHSDVLEIRLLAALVERHQASFETLQRLAEIHERRGEFAQARDNLEKAAAVKTEPALLLHLARIAYQQHDRTGALGYLAHGRDLDPRNPAIHFFFGMIAVEMDLPLEAQKSLGEAVGLDSNNAWYNYAFGAVLLQIHKAGEAVPYFQKFRRLRPNDPRGQFGLGAAHYYAGNNIEATRELESAARDKGTAAGAHYFLGRLAMRKEDLSGAAEELTHSLSANPQYADAWADLGLVLIRQNKYAEAEKALHRARELDPDGFLPNLNLLVLYQRTKDVRAEAQSKRFEEIKKTRSDKEKELWRMIEVQQN